MVHRRVWRLLFGGNAGFDVDMKEAYKDILKFNQQPISKIITSRLLDFAKSNNGLRGGFSLIDSGHIDQIIREFKAGKIEDGEQDPIIFRTLLAIWSFSKAVYKPNKKTFDAIKRSSFENLPPFIFEYLPEFSFFVPLKQTVPFNGGEPLKSVGFVCNKVFCEGNKYLELTFFDKNTKHFDIFNMTLNAKTLKESFDISKNMCKKKGVKHDQDFKYVFRKHIQEALNILVLISMPDPDYDANPGKFKVIRTKNVSYGPKVFIPSKVRQYRIGDDFAEKIIDGEQQCEGGGVSPHLRRAHWHGYWKGPKDGQQRFIYRWIPPTFVRGTKTTKARNEKL